MSDSADGSEDDATDGALDPAAVPMGRRGNVGFDGRVFLTDAEHQTYLRRRPVRYVRKVIAASNSCSVCGEDGSAENPLQVAHIVPFGLGVVLGRPLR
ncbi:hypothetical protein [Microbacterium sp. No. 7]|uniref:hypothetical protein n=1 Tax=Microbacterium sp. No. 7 TaxID=1714373 RepID=UPI000AA7F494|nr:hypothetical protein [Microbacterium sp. No. 7]